MIWLLSASTNVLVRLLGGDPSAGKEQISEEELRGLVAAHETLGVEERRILDEVFEASTRLVREVMVPRTEVTFLEAGQQVGRAVEETSELPHSRYPVVRGSVDDVVGAVNGGNSLTPSGYIDNGPKETNIRVMSEARTPESFANLTIPTRNGSPVWTPIKVGQVAKVEEGIAFLRERSAS